MPSDKEMMDWLSTLPNFGVKRRREDGCYVEVHAHRLGFRATVEDAMKTKRSKR